eukprot:gene4864-5503_t
MGQTHSCFASQATEKFDYNWRYPGAATGDVAKTFDTILPSSSASSGGVFKKVVEERLKEAHVEVIAAEEAMNDDEYKNMITSESTLELQVVASVPIRYEEPDLTIVGKAIPTFPMKIINQPIMV